MQLISASFPMAGRFAPEHIKARLALNGSSGTDVLVGPRKALQGASIHPGAVVRERQ